MVGMKESVKYEENGGKEVMVMVKDMLRSDGYVIDGSSTKGITKDYNLKGECSYSHQITSHNDYLKLVNEIENLKVDAMDTQKHSKTIA